MYIINDEDGEPLRRFQTKVDAEWFIKDKPEFSIKVIKEKKKKRVKKLTEYELAYKNAKPCLL